MKNSTRFIPTLTLSLAVIAALSCAGCDSSAKRIQQGNDLKILGLAYHGYIDANQVGPSGWNDLKGPEINDVRQRLEAAQFEVVWGMKLEDATAGLSNTILAYPRDGAKQGGKVLYFDGSVRQMTGNELAEELGKRK